MAGGCEGSLAKSYSCCRECARAIGVILSGTATDGTLGLVAIKAEGGITCAQGDLACCESMPRSVIAVECVDFALSPDNISLNSAPREHISK